MLNTSYVASLTRDLTISHNIGFNFFFQSFFNFCVGLEYVALRRFGFDCDYGMNPDSIYTPSQTRLSKHITIWESGDS